MGLEPPHPPPFRWQESPPTTPRPHPSPVPRYPKSDADSLASATFGPEAAGRQNSDGRGLRSSDLHVENTAGFAWDRNTSQNRQNAFLDLSNVILICWLPIQEAAKGGTLRRFGLPGRAATTTSDGVGLAIKLIRIVWFLPQKQMELEPCCIVVFQGDNGELTHQPFLNRGTFIQPARYHQK